MYVLHVTVALINSILLFMALNKSYSHKRYKLQAQTQVFNKKNTSIFSHFDISTSYFIFPSFKLVEINFACMTSKATHTVHKNILINVLYKSLLRRPL